MAHVTTAIGFKYAAMMLWCLPSVLEWADHNHRNIAGRFKLIFLETYVFDHLPEAAISKIVHKEWDISNDIMNAVKEKHTWESKLCTLLFIKLGP